MAVISKRKLESYKRAEKVAQEARRQCSAAYNNDPNQLCDFVIHWMGVTGKIKYEIPTPPKKKLNIFARSKKTSTGSVSSGVTTFITRRTTSINSTATPSN